MPRTHPMTIDHYNAVSHLDHTTPAHWCELLPGDVIDGMGIFRWSRPTHNYPGHVTFFLADDTNVIIPFGARLTVRRDHERPTARFVTDAAHAFYDFLSDAADPGEFPPSTERDRNVLTHIRAIVDDVTRSVVALADEPGDHVCPISGIVDRTFSGLSELRSIHPGLPAHRVATIAAHVARHVDRYDDQPCPVRAIVDDVAANIAPAVNEAPPTPLVRRAAMDDATRTAAVHHVRPVETILADPSEYGVAMAKTVGGYTDGFGEVDRYYRADVDGALNDAVNHTGYGWYFGVVELSDGWAVEAPRKRR